MTPTFEQATEFATRITAAIDDRDRVVMNVPWSDRVFAADRLHVEAFLRAIERAEEGSRDHAYGTGVLSDECPRCYMASDPCPDARRYAEARDEAWAGLVRIGSNYGEKP